MRKNKILTHKTKIGDTKMMTPVKKIRFNHSGVTTPLAINMACVAASLINLVGPYTTGNSNSPLVYISLYAILAISGLITFYKGVAISEDFIEECKNKTVADPNGVFHITLTSVISSSISDEENAKYRKITDTIHLVTFVGSLLCGIMLSVMLWSGCSLKTFYTTGLVTLVGFLIFHIVIYFKGQEVTIN